MFALLESTEEEMKRRLSVDPAAAGASDSEQRRLEASLAAVSDLVTVGSPLFGACDRTRGWPAVSDPVTVGSPLFSAPDQRRGLAPVGKTRTGGSGRESESE